MAPGGGRVPAAPRVVGDGYDDQGREVLTYIEGRIAHPHPYTDEGIWQVGRLLGRDGALEPPQPRARRARQPLRRRPHRPLEELAATGWWNARLGFGDDLDPGGDAPDAAARRGSRLRSFLDGYGLPAADRPGPVTRMIEFAVRDCAGLAEARRITPASNDPTTLWTLAWQTRAAAWMLRHRPLLERSMTG